MTAPRRRSPHKNIRGWVERPDRGQQRQQHAPSPTQYLANERDGERGAGSASESRGARRRCLPSPSPSPSQVRTGNPTGRRWTPGRSSQPCRSRCSTRPPRPPSLRSRTTLPRSLSLPQTPQTSQTSQTRVSCHETVHDWPSSSDDPGKATGAACEAAESTRGRVHPQPLGVCGGARAVRRVREPTVRAGALQAAGARRERRDVPMLRLGDWPVCGRQAADAAVDVVVEAAGAVRGRG